MKHHDLRVRWTVHARRALTGLAHPQRDPWHKHLFRTWQSLLGHPRYAPPPSATHSPEAVPVRSLPLHIGLARSRADSSVRARLAEFDLARRNSGI